MAAFCDQITLQNLPVMNFPIEVKFKSDIICLCNVKSSEYVRTRKNITHKTIHFVSSTELLGKQVIVKVQMSINDRNDI